MRCCRKAEGERQSVRVPHLAAQSGDFQLSKDAALHGQRNHLGPQSAEHGRQHAQVFLGARQYRIFVKSRDYHFDVDAVRIPYDAETKKARTRSIFVGKKWLESGYNPKDVWSVSRLHRQHAEREDHPTQKPLEIVEAHGAGKLPSGGTVLDPFMGSGTSAVAAARNGPKLRRIRAQPRLFRHCRKTRRRSCERQEWRKKHAVAGLSSVL